MLAYDRYLHRSLWQRHCEKSGVNDSPSRPTAAPLRPRTADGDRSRGAAPGSETHGQAVAGKPAALLWFRAKAHRKRDAIRVIYDERVDSVAIAGLLRPYAELNPQQLEQTITYLELLLKWNAKVNLTSVRGAEQIVTRHFGESFFAGRQLVAVNAATSVIALGSGAGFPGLPIPVLS